MPSRRPDDFGVNDNSFIIELDGVDVGNFAKAEGIETSTKVLTLDNGKKQPGQTTYANIILREGIVNNDSLWRWYKDVINGQVERKSGDLIVRSSNGDEINRYKLFEAWPCRWKNAVQGFKTGNNFIEEIEIAVEKIERI